MIDLVFEYTGYTAGVILVLTYIYGLGILIKDLVKW